MPSIFILPVWMLPQVGIPGLTLLTPKFRRKWSQYPIMFAHVALGLSAGSVVFHYALTLRSVSVRLCRPHVPPCLRVDNS